MNKVSLTITSEVDVEDIEELFECLKPIIKMVLTGEIHTNVLQEGEDTEGGE